MLQTRTGRNPDCGLSYIPYKKALSLKNYVAKVKGLCALLEASGSPISEVEQKEFILAGLPSDYEAIVSSASLLPTLLPLRRIIDTLFECENRQARAVQEVTFAANLMEGSTTPLDKAVAHGGRSHSRGRGRSFRPRNTRPNAPGPTSNSIQLDSSLGRGPHDRQSGGIAVPWHTKPVLMSTLGLIRVLAFPE
ncbi:hypothetical protein J1N35_044292 [Gossypium stocksii]|uniref:Uncharacterized protein n=1 Tax=Gossypium stocksii TaxID=47602 RepID=A0A9D3U974_9ROSI|nr:hypothetical protein J1N35_044292 [Gossypium stocksii]